MAAIPLTTLIARLDAARIAYHELVTSGGIRTVVDQNGERIEYTVANAARLAAYIQTLEHQVGDATPGPMMVFF